MYVVVFFCYCVVALEEFLQYADLGHVFLGGERHVGWYINVPIMKHVCSIREYSSLSRVSVSVCNS